MKAKVCINVVLVCFLLVGTGCEVLDGVGQGFYRAFGEQASGQKQSRALRKSDLTVDAFGPGIHMGKYGRPVTLWPDWGGIEGEKLKIKENAFGPGIHADQYGRPVREYPLH